MIDEIRKIDFHPDVKVEFIGKAHQVHTDDWLRANVKYRGPEGKWIRATFSTKSDPMTGEVSYIVRTKLPDERHARKKIYDKKEGFTPAITTINRICDGRHPDDDGGRLQRWYNTAYGIYW